MTQEKTKTRQETDTAAEGPLAPVAEAAGADEVPEAVEEPKGRRARAEPMRTCIVTREVLPRDRLLRFVLDPEGRVVFDIKAALPGRGAWVKPERAVLEEAIRRNLFARAFRRKVTVPPDLAGQVQAQLRQAMVQTLSLARKAGVATSGFDRVAAWIDKRCLKVLIEAREGARDGRRKLVARLKRAGIRAEIVDILSSDDLSLAFSRPNVIHAAMQGGGLSKTFLKLARKLAGLEGHSGEDRPARKHQGEQSGR